MIEWICTLDLVQLWVPSHTCRGYINPCNLGGSWMPDSVTSAHSYAVHFEWYFCMLLLAHLMLWEVWRSVDNKVSAFLIPHVSRHGAPMWVLVQNTQYEIVRMTHNTWSVSGECKLVWKPHAHFPDPMVALSSASRYFKKLPGPPWVMHSAHRLQEHSHVQLKAHAVVEAHSGCYKIWILGESYFGSAGTSGQITRRLRE